MRMPKQKTKGSRIADDLMEPPTLDYLCVDSFWMKMALASVAQLAEHPPTDLKVTVP